MRLYPLCVQCLAKVETAGGHRHRLKSPCLSYKPNISESLSDGVFVQRLSEHSGSQFTRKQAKICSLFVSEKLSVKSLSETLA